MNKKRCIVCGADALERAPVSDCLSGVTSDCKPWSLSDPMAICDSCGHFQKVPESEWFLEIKKIYDQYEMYPLSDGKEQAVFDGSAGPIPRTVKLLKGFQKSARIAPQGDLLDIGCGNGALLRAFGNIYHEWRLFGFEQNSVNKKTVLGIEGVRGFHCGSLDNIQRKFDMITMVHVIEHLHEPVNVLKKVRKLLKPHGLLLLHTPCFFNNPFDIPIFDHCSHFCPDTLSLVAQLAGFKLKINSDSWVEKEIGLLATPSDSMDKMNIASAGRPDKKAIHNRIAWLIDVAEQARSFSKGKTFGILGTSVAATWLENVLGNNVDFFVDEDPSRQGNTHMGLAVLNLADVPEDARIYVAFPPQASKKICKRLEKQYPHLCFIIPPAYNPPI